MWRIFFFAIIGLNKPKNTSQDGATVLMAFFYLLKKQNILFLSKEHFKQTPETKSILSLQLT